MGIVVLRGEPAPSHLLTLAVSLRLTYLVGFLGVKIGGGIVEGDVGVPADADEAEVDGRAAPRGSGRASPVRSVSPLDEADALRWTLEIKRP